MAKCIKMRDGEYAGRIVRVPDEYANQLVHTDKRAKFVPKEAWKEGLKPEDRTKLTKGKV